VSDGARDPADPAETGASRSVEGIVSTILFALLILVILLQVAGRTPLAPSVVWTEEAARWVWVWMALVGLAEVERTDGQLRMTFLIDLLPARTRTALWIVFDLVWLAAAAQLALVAWSTVGRTMRNQAVTLPTTDAVLYAAFLVGIVLAGLRVALRLRARLTNAAPA
jgi:TRAP-type C4-dicarboxylate transport system permease small subunit